MDQVNQVTNVMFGITKSAATNNPRQSHTIVLCISTPKQNKSTEYIKQTGKSCKVCSSLPVARPQLEMVQALSILSMSCCGVTVSLPCVP